MRLEITFGDDEIKKWMEPWQEPHVKSVLRKAASAYGRAGKPIVQAATPVARPGNTYAIGPGNLRAATRFKRIKSNPAIGVVIGPMGKKAFYRHMVVGGTKPHPILPKQKGSRGLARRLAILGGFANLVHHPGARPNPYIARVAGAVESAGLRAAERVIFKGLTDSRAVPAE